MIISHRPLAYHLLVTLTMFTVSKTLKTVYKLGNIQLSEISCIIVLKLPKFISPHVIIFNNRIDKFNFELTI